MSVLKLLALDTDDLAILSAHVQDGVLKVGDLEFAARTGVFTMVLNRFVWEEAKERAAAFERRRAVLIFKRVRAVRSIGFSRSNRASVLALLALKFTPAGEGPEGQLELLLAGGATIVLDVECIEGQLADTGGAWETTSRPRHPLDG